MGVKNLIKMNNKRPTPITDDAFDAYYRSACGTADLRDKMEQLEHERDEARYLVNVAEAIQRKNEQDVAELTRELSAMREELQNMKPKTNTSVYGWRIPDLEKNSIENELELMNNQRRDANNDREKAINELCLIKEENKAMRDAIKEAHKTVTFLNDFHSYGQSVMANATLAKLQPFITP